MSGRNGAGSRGSRRERGAAIGQWHPTVVEARRLRVGVSAGFLAALCLAWSCLPLPARAAGQDASPPKPRERVIFQNGPWATEYLGSAEDPLLVVSYQGRHAAVSAVPEGGAGEKATGRSELPGPTSLSKVSGLKMRLRSAQLLRNIYLPLAETDGESAPRPAADGHPSVRFQDRQGNVYGPFPASHIDYTLREAGRSRNPLAVALLEGETVLPAGDYEVHISSPVPLVRNEETGLVPAILVKGVDYRTWRAYKEKLLPENGFTVIGSSELARALEDPGAYTPPRDGRRAVRPASLELSVPSLVEQIVFDAYNGGKGSVPGTVSIVDGSGETVGTFQASGAAAGGVANALWVVRPDVVLKPGHYTLVVSEGGVITGDAVGNPAFAVRTAPASPRRFDFTGTYSVDLSVVRTSTLMGPVSEGQPSVSLEDFELTVLDRGEALELIGKYEEMPFSQIARVTKREEERVEATVQGSVRVRVPKPALLGATVAIVLEKRPGLVPILKAEGQGTYLRPATKDKGPDYNTYRITARGTLVNRDPPPFVAAAFARRLGSAGKVPGPDTPFQAAAGALFPPLAAVIAQVIQNAFRRSREGQLLEERRKLEEMRKNWRALLPEERERLALALMADALAHSDEPDADRYATGEGEAATAERADEFLAEAAEEVYAAESADTGEEYAAAEQEEWAEEELALPEPEELAHNFFGSERERLAAERDEWEKNLEDSLRSADPDDPQAQRLHEQYREYIAYLDGRLREIDELARSAAAGEESPSLVLPIDHTGRTAEVRYDPLTGQWVNAETGNIFDMERYEKDVLPGFERDRQFIEEQRRKLETRDTAFDRAIDALVQDQAERGRLLAQLQGLRNRAYGIAPPAPEVGDVQANIETLIEELSRGAMPTEELRDRAVRVARVVTGRLTGRTLSEEEGRRLGELYTSTASILAHTAAESGLDVVTGRTWAGMAGRLTLAAVTGGYSEIPLSVGEALYDIKQDIEAGESGVRATLKAMGKYALGELAGAYGEEALKHSGWRLNEEALEKLSAKLNTPVSELLGGQGGGGILEGAVEKAGKGLVSSTDTLARRAPDAADYLRYRTEVRDTAEMVAAKIRAGSGLDTDDLRRVLRDPSITRELKGAPEEVRRAYQDALESKLYNPALSNTRHRVTEALNADPTFRARIEKEFGPGARVEVEIDTIRTPGTAGEGTRLNADNDLTGRLVITDAQGNMVHRELPAEKIAGVYHEEFAKAAGMLDEGGNFNVAKAQAEMPDVDWSGLSREQQLEVFAKRHNQEVTDVFSPEASVDFNRWAQHSLRRDLPPGTSAVDLLKSGAPSARLGDPQGLAMMEVYKVKEFFNHGGLANQTEAYEQLAKMGRLTGDLAEAYRKLGFPVQDMPENMVKALEVVRNRSLSPGARALALQELGFSGPEDLANKLAGRIEGLQKLGDLASRGAAAPGASAVSGGAEGFINRVISAIVGAHLKDER